jgi:hypothetical protein
MSILKVEAAFNLVNANCNCSSLKRKEFVFQTNTKHILLRHSGLTLQVSKLHSTLKNLASRANFHAQVKSFDPVKKF